jgi:hypothetical protein
MSLIISFLAGLSVKVYDDLNDNVILQKFRNDTFMEFLKGFHYILFTSISIEEPLFLIIQYVANVLNYIGNTDCWCNSYEHSLLYSFMLVFILIDYKKIKQIPFLDMLLMIGIFIGTLTEPIAMCYFLKNSEFSFQKMIIRILLILTLVVCNYLSESMALKHWYYYMIGYFIFSVLVQYYSLITTKEEQIKEKQIKEEQIKKKQIKEEQIKEEQIKEEQIKEIKKKKKININKIM